MGIEKITKKIGQKVWTTIVDEKLSMIMCTLSSHILLWKYLVIEFLTMESWWNIKKGQLKIEAQLCNELFLKTYFRKIWMLENWRL